MTHPDLIASILLTFGGLFLIGLTADLLGRHTPLPRVTLLIFTGFLIGPSTLNWLPTFAYDWFPILTDIALAMIGFLLGQNLTREKLTTMGRPIIGISISVMMMTATLMFFGLWLLGVPIEMALILAGIAPATAPAPVIDVTREIDAKGPFTDTLLGVVAIDDAWGMLLFSFLLVVATIVGGNGHSLDALNNGLWEVFGALLLGGLLGFPMAFLNSHLYPGKSSQAEVLGLVLLCAGLAEMLEVSYILSAMMMGTVVANFSTRHRHRPFDELEMFEWPLLILFFLLAGASLNLSALYTVGYMGAGYIVFRVLGRIFGSYIGAKWARCDQKQYAWMGFAMLPHAGVPIGMALLAIQQFPHLKAPILAVILSATIVFELVGPIATRWLLIRSGESTRQTELDFDSKP
ncbi:Na(+)/H(+)-K(+) antiporter GerN [Hydrogenovibrio crunogenus]|uniref:Na(+)/H(+)-K(+) antiporter GerN n=1 Tax=Hydrogenovibrio crunogenus TaxID=39765 RepID=A0A4P7NWZ9_9GAMM|nr:cation:proton antiporter [Hydrogenovibrio crunogenus]QBZ82009.1 Na(+)/H(+)-K(+) antiporter GerN [Hydrogenovibrio crunogenus]RUM91933.1 MAG: cation:proton antiporter [Thiomicrospira sp.]